MRGFQDVLRYVEANRQRALSGDFNCIPWGLPRFEQFSPGLERQKYYIVTANTKVGKTQLSDYMFLYTPFAYLKQHPDLDIRLKVIYISMEMTKQEKILQAISRKLYMDSKGKVRLSPTQIKSVGLNNVLSQEVLDKIKSYQGYFEEFEDIVTIIDDVRNPWGIYKTVKEQTDSLGWYTTKEIVEDGKRKVINTKFNLHHENSYVIVIVDNYNILVPEHDASIHKAISKFSADYALTLRNNHGFIIAAIQQQSADQESLDRFKENKLEPSLDGLGDNKLTSRDANQIFGFFSPARHQLQHYKGYDITRLGDHFRTLSILGGRDGGAGIQVPVYFDGAVNYLREMPNVKYDSQRKVVNAADLDIFYKMAEKNYSFNH